MAAIAGVPVALAALSPAVRAIGRRPDEPVATADPIGEAVAP
jgi:hypothetical protein